MELSIILIEIVILLAMALAINWLYSRLYRSKLNQLNKIGTLEVYKSEFDDDPNIFVAFDKRPDALTNGDYICLRVHVVDVSKPQD